ncbi:MAG TPA: hypothetical protein VH853_20055 [Polyangia bacterium]|nr:hypothetical protein [Polyangia bacterium]
MSRTASTGFVPEPLPPELVDRLRDLFAGLLPDLLGALLLDLAAGRAFFVELALVDFELRDELGRAEAEGFFV